MRRKYAAWGCAAAGWLALSPAAVQQAPASAASASDLTPAERAKRDADKVFKWILIHADKPREPDPGRDGKREGGRDEKPLAAIRAMPAARAAEASPPAASPALAAVENEPDAARVARLAPVAVIENSLAVVEACAVLSNATPTPAVVAAESIEETLTPLFRAEPEFSTNLLRTLRKGAVQLRFTVLPDGSVTDPAVVTSTHARLNPSAPAAIAQWRFSPLRKPLAGLNALDLD